MADQAAQPSRQIGSPAPLPAQREADAARRLRQGLGLFLAALLCFACYDAFAKHMLTRYPATVMNLSRYTAVGMLALWVMHRHGDWSALRWERLRSGKLLLLRSLMLAIVATCFMTALATMPLAEATAIYFTAPLIMVALSPWLLGERVGRVQWVALLLGFAGMLLIVRPGNALPLAGTVLMAVSAVCYALFQVLTRKLSGVVPTAVQFAYMALFCLVITNLPALFHPITAWPNAPQLALLLAGGFVSGGAQLLLLQAFQRASASTLAPMNYVQLLLAVLISTFWFQRPPDSLALYGMLMISAAGVYLAWPRRQKHTAHQAPRHDI
ncbi:DMT family transporter [Comamonas koreensis]|uniref:DMT family transporter n=1 Tax=Comamonas koreensis TaxID=160825 RepID=A0AAW4Y0V5_9BURK|nr:DMT family transporter [Comamonas koreensis]MCD2166699.1 DMT family transporter [Comamonas koreensis]